MQESRIYTSWIQVYFIVYTDHTLNCNALVSPQTPPQIVPLLRRGKSLVRISWHQQFRHWPRKGVWFHGRALFRSKIILRGSIGSEQSIRYSELRGCLSSEVHNVLSLWHIQSVPYRLSVIQCAVSTEPVPELDLTSYLKEPAQTNAHAHLQPERTKSEQLRHQVPPLHAAQRIVGQCASREVLSRVRGYQRCCHRQVTTFFPWPTRCLCSAASIPISNIQLSLAVHTFSTLLLSVELIIL